MYCESGPPFPLHTTQVQMHRMRKYLGAYLVKLKGKVELVSPGSLPRDGLVIEDQRSYD